MPHTEAECSRGWHMLTSVFEALMVQFPASLAGSRIIIKDAVSLCAGEHCTVLFPMSLDQEGLWHSSTTDNSQWLLRGVLEAIWLPQWNHGQRGQIFERSSREERAVLRALKILPSISPVVLTAHHYFLFMKKLVPLHQIKQVIIL